MAAESKPFLAPSYFAPDWFTPDWFAAAPAVVSDPTIHTDQAAFDDIVARLTATGRFVQAAHSTQDEILFPSALSVPFAAVIPTTTTETPLCDDGTKLREVAYTIAIVVRGEDVGARKSALSTLEAAARNAVDQVSLGGFCLPRLSNLGVARWPRPKHPAQRVEIAGKFTYLIESPGSRDLTDTYPQL